MQNETKRLFFGLQVHAPWPKHLPEGRILAESDRHITLAFIGNTNFSHLRQQMTDLPRPSLEIGLLGFFDAVLFLPKSHPRVVAWNVKWIDEACGIEQYQKVLTDWLMEKGISVDIRHRFLAHTTICRSPTDKKLWAAAFKPLPMFVSALHLYESLGNCHYRPVWSMPFIPPFTITNDSKGFTVTLIGNTIEEIHQHARMALCFINRDLIFYTFAQPPKNHVENILKDLNSMANISDKKSCNIKTIESEDEMTKKIKSLALENAGFIDYLNFKA